MNVNTGDLYKLSGLSEEQINEMFGRGIQSVPEELEAEAEKELGDKKHVKVDMNKNTPLVNWAKKKKKRQMAKASKKKNRR